MSGGAPRDPLMQRFDDALERDDSIELQRLAREVALDCEEREWAETGLARLAKHHNANVRGDALAGFGHLARRFGILDRNRVQRLIETGLHARHEYLREQAESAAADVETFLSWHLDRPAP